MKRNVRRWAMVAVLAMAAGACGGSDDDDAGGSTGTGDGTTTTAARSGSPDTSAGAADEDLDVDATLRLAVNRQNTTFDPPKGATTSEEQQLDMIYDKLVRVNPEGEVTPELAESWEFTPEGLQLTIRQGVTFHDGAPLDAEAVKVNLDRARTMDDSAVKGDLAPVTEVRVVDPSTVLLVMPEKNVTVLPLLGTRAGAMASPQAIADGVDLATQPVGAGPFRMVELTPGVGQTLERFEDYWREDAVDVAGIEITVLPDPIARLNAVRTGAADMALLEANLIGDAESAGLHVETTVLQSVTSLQINSDRVPAFADERVRQAVNFAIDREGIVEGVLRGHGEAVAQYFTQPLAHDPDLADPYPHDPDRARELLEEAGFPDGFEFTVNFGGTPSAEEVEAIAGSLAEVGIVMNVEQLPGNEPIQRMWTQKSGDALAFPGNTFIDPSLAFGTFLPDNLRNPANLVDDEVVSLWQQSLTIEDFDERAEVLQAASRQLTEHPLSVVPLYSNTGSWVMTDDVVGFSIPPTNLYSFRDVGLLAG